MKKNIYIIGIGGIGISAIARYYLKKGHKVFGSDINNSELIEKLKKEGCNIIIGSDEKRIEDIFFDENTKKNGIVIYTEAINKNNKELLKARRNGIKNISYPQALADITKEKKLIAISGTHGKSTTTSLTSLVLKNSKINVNAIVGTLLKEFGNKNTYFSNSDYFVIEACEYKRSFLNYKPLVGIITNIDLDHLDYYKDLNDYISAFEEFIDNIDKNGFIILNGECENSKKLVGKRKDINYIEIYSRYTRFTNTKGESEIITFPKINMKVPGSHVLFDAHISYMVGYMLGIENEKIIESLENYSGVNRRMEIIGKTKGENILMSDYGHHPTEIKATLKALKDQNPARPILTIFQPHQYSRTIELLKEFKKSFYDTDSLIIPNIYESRDSSEDKEKINTSIFVESIDHKEKINGENFENTIKLIKNWDQENNFGIILLMGAGDIDNLRNKIYIKK